MFPGEQKKRKGLMQTKGTRIAYLKRMLKRLEGEFARLKELVGDGIMTEDASKLTFRQLDKQRDELIAEINALQKEEN
jgi:hypothetical protein